MPSQRAQCLRITALSLSLWALAAPGDARNTTTLTWTSNTESDLAGYRVERALTACLKTNSGAFHALKTILGNIATYIDVTVPAEATIACYGVRAYDVAGNVSGLSNLVEKAFPIILRAVPSALTLQATVNAPDPPAQVVTFSTVGTGPLSWTITPPPPWLIVTPTTGTKPGPVSIQVKRGTLAAGATLTVTPTGGTPASVAVTLTVLPDTTSPASPVHLSIAPGTSVPPSQPRPQP